MPEHQVNEPSPRNENISEESSDQYLTDSDSNHKLAKIKSVSNITDEIMTSQKINHDEIEKVNEVNPKDLFSTNRLENLNQKNGESDVPGLADVLNKMWPPSMVEPKQRKAATIFFLGILVLYAAYAAASCVMMISRRLSPSISYTKDVNQTLYKSPYWTFCRPYGKIWWEGNDNFQLTPYCNVLFQDGTFRACDMVQTTISNNKGDYCIVLNINEDISAFFPSITIEFTLYEPGNPYSWLNYYVSDFEPTEGMDWSNSIDPFDFGWLAMGAEYDLNVLKMENRILDASWGGLKTNPKDILSYSTTPRYDRARDVYAYSTSSLIYYDITLHIWTDPQGVEILEENDPVDSFNLVGSIAGLFGYVTLVFMSVFGTTIYRHMKAMEEQKVQEIIRRVKREAQI